MNGLPRLKSITVHPGNRASLDAQLPTALVFGQMIPADVQVIESVGVELYTLRLHFDDYPDVTCTLGEPPPEPQRWIRCDPLTGTPLGQYGSEPREEGRPT